MKSRLKKLLLGFDSPTEYVCVGDEGLSYKPKVFFKWNNETFDLTSRHILLGYKPLLIGIPADENDPWFEAVGRSELIGLYLSTPELTAKPMAELRLKKSVSYRLNGVSLFVFEGVLASYYLLNRFYDLNYTILRKLKSRNPDNLDLPGNLYKQVRTAYSIPRNISLASVGTNHLYNLFPTDLHGRINEHYYTSSLRPGGEACKQLMLAKRLVIAVVSARRSKTVYSMGRNHMKDLRPIDEFDLKLINSEVLGFPIMQETLRYFELEVINFFDIGIHRIFIYKTIHSEILTATEDSLSHIHRDYLAWRNRKGLETKVWER